SGKLCARSLERRKGVPVGVLHAGELTISRLSTMLASNAYSSMACQAPARRILLWRLIGLAGALMPRVAVSGAIAYGHGLLWRLDRSALPPSFVFGTLHSNDARITMLPGVVTHAFSLCRTFAMEVYLSDTEE